MTAQAGGAASNDDRKRIRSNMRLRRANLSAADRTKVALKILHHLNSARLLRAGKRIGIYLAVRGEVDLKPVIALARQRHCKLFLPRIRNFSAGEMEFVPLPHSLGVRKNKYGVRDGVVGGHAPISPRRLDIVLTPLVAFDARGWRLGMGAGFYDRYFAFLKGEKVWHRPKLIGVAYDFQQVPALTPQPWDVPLDAIVTESGLLRARRIR